VNENVLGLQVAMNDAPLSKLLEPHKDLPHYAQGFGLGHGRLFFEQGSQIPVLAIFQDQVNVILAFEDIEEFNNMVRADSSHGLDLKQQ
jgi:hypothetical protein